MQCSNRLTFRGQSHGVATPWLSALAAGWLLASSIAIAQPAFGPPPVPAAATSGVRGVYDPNAAPSSPATIAPPPSTPAKQREPGGAVTPTPTGNAQPLVGGEIVARVDGQIVLASDVLWQVNQMMKANRGRIPPGEEDNVRRMLIAQQVLGLIDTKLLYADFRRKVPAENVPNIEKNLEKPFEEQEIPRLIKMLDLKDRRELAALMAGNGTSLGDVQRQYTERTIAGEWLRQRVPKPKPVTHEEMLEHYQAHLADYQSPAQARWEEVMVSLQRFAGDRAAAWRAMAEIGNEVWQRVTENPGIRGPIFTEIAKQKSHGLTAADGGSHAWTTRGALRSKAIDEALFNLQVGQLSNIIESDDGFHIVRVLERQDAGCKPFTEAQAGIRDTLKKEQQQELVKLEIIKLRKASRVWTVFDGDLSGPEVAELLDRRQRR